MKLLSWKIYEVTSPSLLQKVMFRGRLRKFCLQKSFNILTENDEDNKNCVRFALLDHGDENMHTLEFEIVRNFLLEKIDGNIEIEYIGDFNNPVLSKIKVNDVSRYEI